MWKVKAGWSGREITLTFCLELCSWSFHSGMPPPRRVNPTSTHLAVMFTTSVRPVSAWDLAACGYVCHCLQGTCISHCSSQSWGTSTIGNSQAFLFSHRESRVWVWIVFPCRCYGTSVCTEGYLPLLCPARFYLCCPPVVPHYGSNIWLLNAGDPFN